MNERQERELREILGIMIGRASMCWIPAPGQEVFDSESAIETLDDAIERIRPLFSLPDKSPPIKLPETGEKPYRARSVHGGL